MTCTYNEAKLWSTIFTPRQWSMCLLTYNSIAIFYVGSEAIVVDARTYYYAVVKLISTDTILKIRISEPSLRHNFMYIQISSAISFGTFMLEDLLEWRNK